MATAHLTVERSIVLEGGDRHRHAARRLREAYPGIDWRDGGPGPALVLREDTSLPEGAFRVEAEPSDQRVTIW